MNFLLSALLALLAFARRGFRKLTQRERVEAQLLLLQWFPCSIEGGQFLIKLGFYGPGTFALIGTPGANYDPTQPVSIRSPVKDHLIPWNLIDDDELAAMTEAVCAHEERQR